MTIANPPQAPNECVRIFATFLEMRGLSLKCAQCGQTNFHIHGPVTLMDANADGVAVVGPGTPVMMAICTHCNNALSYAWLPIKHAVDQHESVTADQFAHLSMQGLFAVGENPLGMTNLQMWRRVLELSRDPLKAPVLLNAINVAALAHGGRVK